MFLSEGHHPDITHRPNPETLNTSNIIHIDAIAAEYDDSRYAFRDLTDIVEKHPEVQKIISAYKNGDVVLRGFHRFVPSEAALTSLLTELWAKGLDRSEEIGRTGERLHVVAEYMKDPWSLALTFSTESEATRPSKEAHHSIGIILVFDNTDGQVVYAGDGVSGASKTRPLSRPADIETRDQSLHAALYSPDESNPKTWKDRLLKIIVIEYPFIPRKPSLADKVMALLKRS